MADPTSNNASRVTFTVARSACIAPYSGNLRICWSDTACENFFFEPGKTVDLGLLPRPVVNKPPSVGGGQQAAGRRTLSRQLMYAAAGLLSLGVLGLVVVGESARRRRKHQ